MKKIIIWLFEKYAYDYWIDLQSKEDDKRLLEKYLTDDIEEARQCEIGEQQVQLNEIYDAGYQDGFNKILEEREIY